MKRIKKKVTFDCNQYIKTFDKTKPSSELSETIKESLMTIIKHKSVAVAVPPQPSATTKKKIGDMSIITRKSPEKTSKKSPTKTKTSKTTTPPSKSKKSPTKARKK